MSQGNTLKVEWDGAILTLSPSATLCTWPGGGSDESMKEKEK